MKSKQVLDVQQMQHLQELGLDTSNASMLYCDLYDEEYILVESKHRFDKEENAILLEGVRNSVIYCKKVTPAYTLQDVLDALPKYYHIANIGWTKLSIRVHTTKEWEIGYVYTDELSKYVYGCRILSKELIDAAYELFCWCVEWGFVETNKNE